MKRFASSDIPVIYTTGYDKQQVLPGLDAEKTLVLAKPLDVLELSQHISQ